MMLEPAPLHELRLDPDSLVPYEAEIELLEANRTLRLSIGGIRMVSASCFWDPAFGRPEKGDSSVVAVVFADAEGNYYLHDLRYLDSSPARAEEDEATVMCRQVADFLERNAVPHIAVESNGLGRFLPAILRRELSARRLAVAVEEHHSTIPKDRRILESFDPLLAARRLRVHRRVLRTPFVAEMRDFRPGGGGRDDALDAVAACLAREPVRIGSARPLARRDWRPQAAPFRARTVLDR